MITWQWVMIKAPKGAEKKESRRNGKNRMVREKWILYFGTFQFLQVIPEYASLHYIEVLSFEV